METEPEGTSKKYIFLVDNQDIAMNIVISGYQALYLGQEDDGYYFSVNSFIEDMRSIQFHGTCQSAYHYVAACTTKWMNDRILEFCKESGLDGKAGWQLFKEKEYLGKLDNQPEVGKTLEQFILRFEREPKNDPELSRFHKFDSKGKVSGVRDMEIVDYIVENVSFFVRGESPYYYEHGVFIEDTKGVKLKFRIQKLIYRDQVNSSTSQIEKGEVIAWSKDKYNLFRQQVKDSFVADCAMAVLKAMENCISKEKFIEKMKQFGWNVNWTEKRKLITFQNQDGKKVRDSNLSKTFHLDISKEGLENEFNGNYERIRAEAERTNGSDEELAVYYRQVEVACEGAGRNAGESDGGEGRITGEKSEDERVYPEISGKDTQAENGKTESILRESRNARRNSEIKRRNSSFDNRTVRNAEAESIASEEQRRFEEQKRIEEQERARAARRRNKRRSGPEL